MGRNTITNMAVDDTSHEYYSVLEGVVGSDGKTPIEKEYSRDGIPGCYDSVIDSEDNVNIEFDGERVGQMRLVPSQYNQDLKIRAFNNVKERLEKCGVDTSTLDDEFYLRRSDGKLHPADKWCDYGMPYMNIVLAPYELRDPKDRVFANLFPALDHYRIYGEPDFYINPVKQFLYDNFVTRSWRYVLPVYLVSLILCFFISQGFFPASWFPFDTYITDLISNIFLFFLGVLSSRSYDKYTTLTQTLNIGVGGTNLDFPIHVKGAVEDQLITKKVKVSKKTIISEKGKASSKLNIQRVAIQEVTVWRILMDFYFTINFYSYAIIHEFRNQRNCYGDEGFDIEKMAVPRETKNLIKSEYVDGIPGPEVLRSIWSNSLGDIRSEDVLPKQTISGFINELNTLGSQLGIFSYYTNKKPIPFIQRNFMLIALIIVCWTLPFIFYDYFGLVIGIGGYLIAVLVAQFLLIGFFVSNDYISDPFNNGSYTQKHSAFDAKTVVRSISYTSTRILTHALYDYIVKLVHREYHRILEEEKSKHPEKYCHSSHSEKSMVDIF